MPAGGTFTTYENVSGKMDASLVLIYNRRVKTIKSRLSLTAGGDYACTPTFIGSRKNLTRSYSPHLGIRLTSNFSTKVRIVFSSGNAFIYARNDIGDDNRYFQEKAGCTVESNFAKRIFFNANYEYTLYKPIGDIGRRNERNMLNLICGCKFHKGMGSVSVSCYDLLNRSTAFKTSMNSDYIRNGWTPTFGRYWSVNIGYRFNKTKSGAKPGGMRLNDGRENIKM